VKTTRSNTKDFVKKAVKIHGDKRYEYNKVAYVDATTEVIIHCNSCNRDFNQTPATHLSNHGCTNRKCSIYNNRKTKITNEIFVINSISAHGDLYNYTYIGDLSIDLKANIICKKHGPFRQNIHNHMNGHGCPICGQLKKRSYKNKSTLLYYIAVNDIFKIGLTTKSISKRYCSEIKSGVEIKEIASWQFDDGDIAFELEQMILHDFDSMKYNGCNILLGGNTELFSVDILDYIKPVIENKIYEIQIENISSV